MEVFTDSARKTAEFGKDFANRLKGGEVLALSGGLGSGKTTFVQGLAQGLGIAQRIISPTFIVVREYNLKRKRLYHIDLYRLEGNMEQEIKNLGLEDIWGKEENIVVVEWAEKIKGLLPKGTTWIKFHSLGGGGRRITVE